MIELFPGFLLAAIACLGAGGIVFLTILRVSPSSGPLEDLKSATLIGIYGLFGIACLAWLAALLGIFQPMTFVAPWLLGLFVLLGLRILMQIAGFRGFESIAMGSLLLVITMFSAREVLHGDTGNYHHQAVLWMSGWQLPLGLANLHGRFGFNSGWWSFASIFEFPWAEKGSSIYYPVGILSFFIGCLMFEAIAKIWSGGIEVSDAVLLTAFYLWFRQVSGINNPSFSTDSAANLLIVASAWGFTKWRENEHRLWFGFWCVLAATAASFKLTALPWLAVSALAAGGLIGWRALWNRQPLTPFFPAVAIGLAILLTHAARGILISGYPFYPTKLLGLGSLAWAVPHETISGDTDGVRNWPTRGEADGVFTFASNWVQNQFGMTNLLFGLLLVVGLVAAITLLLRRVGAKKIANALIRYSPLLGASAVGFSLCFAYAPALRFVSGYFFVMAGALLGIAIVNAPSRPTFSRIAIVAMIVCGTFLNLRSAAERKIHVVAKPVLPSPVVEALTTDQGEQIRVNRTGFSWATTPPATPYFNERLTILRDQAGVIRGFASQNVSARE